MRAKMVKNIFMCSVNSVRGGAPRKNLEFN